MIPRLFFSALAVLGAAVPVSAPPQEAAPAHLSQHQTTADDIQAIEKLLETYTAVVTNGNKAAFEALLLNEELAFSSTNELVRLRAEGQNIDTRRYPRFRKSVFDSGGQFTQRFCSVHIQQDGDAMTARAHPTRWPHLVY